MLNASVVTQVRAIMPNRVGLLADVTESLRAAGVNITAVAGYHNDDSTAEFMLLTTDASAAADACRRLNADVREERVVAVEMPDRAGALEEVARKIAEAGIDIHWVYGSVAPGAMSAVCVFKTADPDKTVSILG